MPIQQTRDGKWRYGERGKKYDTRAEALRQMRAVHARRRSATARNGAIEMGMNPEVPLMTRAIGDPLAEHMADLNRRFGTMGNLPPIQY